jgi:hypothetical protein
VSGRASCGRATAERNLDRRIVPSLGRVMDPASLVSCGVSADRSRLRDAS